MGLIRVPAVGCGRRVPQWTDVLNPLWKSREQKINWLAALGVEQRRTSAVVHPTSNI